MKVRMLAALAVLFVFPSEAARAAPPARAPSAQAEHIARLAGLCRVWGTVKYFHPYLAYRPIDWDLALVQAIPKVSAAGSPGEYRAAIDSLLSLLHDPNTHTVQPPGASAPTPAPDKSAPPQPSFKMLPDGTAVITATDYGQFTGYDVAGRMATVLAQAGPASAIIFDLRRSGPVPPGGDDYSTFALSQALISALPGLLARDLPLPVTRHRMHSGYSPADGNDHGGYYSAFVTPQGRFLPAQGDEKSAKPMRFLVNQGSADIHDILGGLQAAQLAIVIQEGAGGEEVGVPNSLLTLADGVQVQVRTGETVNPDGSLGFRPDVAVPVMTPGGTDAAMRSALQAVRTPALKTAAPVGEPARPYSAPPAERGYEQMAFPAPEYRLLSLFRFWNIIQYFSPYKDLIGRPWDDVLTEYIPKMEEAGDALAYGTTAARMIAEIHDSHGAAYVPALAKQGRWTPPVALREVEGQTIIAAVTDPKVSDLRVGHVVLSVDGEPVAARRRRLGPLHAASTPQALSFTLSQVLLNGPKGSAVALTVRDAARRARTVTLARTERYVLPPPRPTPVYGRLPSGFGYMDLARLNAPDVDKAFAAIAGTPAVIFDMRGYPNGTAWAIAPYLASRPAVGAKFEVPQPQAPDDASVSRFVETIQPNPAHHYGGRAVVLIDESAISQAEHTCLFLEAAGHVTFIGTPTEGANGEVTSALLPGGVFFSFTGMAVRHGDGRQLQRIGIQPTLRVAPTVAGLRAGRDEILEAAVRFLRKPASGGPHVSSTRG